MHSTIVSTALALLLAAPAGLATAQELPKWLIEAQAREAKLPPLVPLVSEDGWLRTQVHGRVDHKVVLQDDSYAFSITVDPTLTVHCEVGRGERDLANLLVQASAAGFKTLAESGSTVEARAVERTDAGAIEGHAYMGLQWIYRLKQQGEQRVGALHQFAAVVGNAMLNCAHEQVGYTRTFRALTRALVSHLRTAREQAPAPVFREISVVSVDGAPVGVGVTSLSLDADGDTKVVNSASMVIQAAPGQLISQDSFDIQWVRPDGSLINAVQVKSSDGKLSEDMALKRVDGVWRASGTLEGKAIDVAITAEPSSFVAQARARRQLMAQANPVGTSTESTSWSSLDLTRLLNSRATVLAPSGTEAFVVREELGEVAMEVVLDRQTGTMASGRMSLGPRTMGFERIYRQGGF